MRHVTVQRRIATVELFIKTGSVTTLQHGFRQQFQRYDAPSCNTVLLWVLKWCQEGSMNDSKPQGHPFSATTPDNVEWVRDTMMRSLCKSARR